MPNEPNQGVLLQVSCQNAPSSVLISDSWLHIQRNAADKLLKRWASKDFAAREALTYDRTYITNKFDDLQSARLLWDSVTSRRFGSLRLFHIPNNMSNEGFFLRETQSVICDILRTRLRNSKLFSLFPRLPFRAKEFNEAVITPWAYTDTNLRCKVSLTINNFNNVFDSLHSSLAPGNDFVKNRNFSNLQGFYSLPETLLGELVKAINYLIEHGYIITHSIETLLEEVIQENMNLICSLRPQITLSPKLVKKILIAETFLR